MPIVIKEYEWSQTDTEIHVVVPFKGLSASSKVDIFTDCRFLKVNFPPFYFELFLAHDIDDTTSRCRVGVEQVHFILQKRSPEVWSKLEENIDRCRRVELKREIIDRAQKANDERRARTAEQREEIKREDIRRNMDREAAVHDEIVQFQRQASSAKVASVTKRRVSSVPAIKCESPTVKIVPGIRAPVSIAVNFSQRCFPTPQRESQAPLEQEWLLKQREAQRVMGFVADDLRAEERNPDWLKDKGDTFFEQKNHLSAISAYSTAIRLTDQRYDLFLNRSAAHFAIENYKRCIEDCSTALDLLTPAVAMNLTARVQCMARRAAALCKLGLVRQGYAEIVAAVQLSPDDVVLRRDAEMIRCHLENSEN